MQYRDLQIEMSVKRIRSLRITIKPDGRICLSVPIGLPSSEVERFLSAQYDWMKRNQQKVLLRAEKQQRLQYADGEQHLLWGQPMTLRIVEEKGRESADIQGDEIILYAHADRNAAQRKQLLYQLVYYPQLRPFLLSLLNRWTERLTAEMKPLERMANPNKYGGIQATIRLMRTEWGSCCPSRHRMTYNLDLARLPKECVEYVVVHEFTHIDHCDHSPAFWSLCDRRLEAAGLSNSKQQRTRIKALVRCGGD